MTVEPSEPRRDSVVRISDLDRGTALATLQQAELEGRLTAAELEERVIRLRQTRTRGELDTLLADLPGRRTPPDETVELRIGTASARIILPPGASADINHFGGGTVRSKVPDQPTGDAPHFRISGSAGTGSLRVTYRRRWFGR